MELSFIWSFVLLFLLILAMEVKTALNCTTPTFSCSKTETKWKEREKLFNCGMQRYTCLLTENNVLVEVCMWNSMITEGMVGCPFIAHCDRRYGPILISEDKYSQCPEHLDGCPNRNHTGYHISEINKYYRCLKVDRTFNVKKSSFPYSMTTPASEKDKVSTTFIVLVIVIPVAAISVTVTILLYRFKSCFNSEKLKKIDMYKSVQTA